jgi:DNA-binding protein YbaB
MDLNAVIDLESAFPGFAEQRRTLEDACAELRAARLDARSQDELVTVTVDGLGTLIDLELDPGRLRAASPRTLAESAVQAVGAARAAAAEFGAREAAAAW